MMTDVIHPEAHYVGHEDINSQPGGNRLAHRRSSGVSKRRAATNRRAQQAWRDRQKDRSQKVAAELDTLQQQLYDVSLAKEVVQQRNATLEQLLALQQETALQNDASEAAAAAMATPEAALEQLAVQRSRMPAEQQEAAWWLDAGTKAALAEKFGIHGNMMFTARQDTPLLATHAQIAAMPHAEWGRLLQTYLNAMAGCLAAVQANDADDTAAARLVGTLTCSIVLPCLLGICSSSPQLPHRCVHPLKGALQGRW